MSNWDFYFDNDVNDLRINSGQYEIVRGANNVAQQVDVTLNMQRTEWYLDQRLGVPWYPIDFDIDDVTYKLGILGDNFNASAINAIILEVLNGVPGVIKVDELNIQDINKTLDISTVITVEEGSVNAVGLYNVSALHSDINSNQVTIKVTK